MQEGHHPTAAVTQTLLGDVRFWPVVASFSGGFLSYWQGAYLSFPCSYHGCISIQKLQKWCCFWIQKLQKWCDLWIQKLQNNCRFWIQNLRKWITRFLDPEIVEMVERSYINNINIKDNNKNNINHNT